LGDAGQGDTQSEKTPKLFQWNKKLKENWYKKGVWRSCTVAPILNVNKKFVDY